MAEQPSSLQPSQPLLQLQQQQQPPEQPLLASVPARHFSSGQCVRHGRFQRIAVSLCVAPVFIMAVTAGVKWRQLHARFSASPDHRTDLFLATAPTELPPTELLVWTWAPEWMSCDHGCIAEAKLRIAGKMGCCREDVWPETAMAFRNRVVRPLSLHCAEIVPGGFPADPSTTARGLCGWQSTAPATRRCEQNPLEQTRRLCPCSLPAGPENVYGELNFVSLADLDQLAVCMDGSPAGYYWRPAARGAGQEHIWFILLQGGGQCYDVETCKKRGHLFSSSESYPAQKKMGGVFAKASPVYNANQIFVPYCSSDGWAGDLSAEDNPTNSHFRGDRIVKAVLKHLVERQGLSPSDLVVFGGQSSGARGAMIHLDRLVWPDGPLPAGVKVLGYLDSPLWIDQATLPVPRYTGGQGDPMTNLTNQTVMLMDLAKTHDVVSTPECIESLGAAWKCWFGMYRIPLLKTPFLLVASQYDQFQASVNLQYGRVRNHSWPEPQEAYSSWMDVFAAATREQLELIVNYTAITTPPHPPTPPSKPAEAGETGLSWVLRFLGMSNGPQQQSEAPRPHPQPLPARGVLSWSCYSHAQSPHENFFKLQVDGVSMAEALRMAIANMTADEAGTHPMPVFVDKCKGLDCGLGCRRSATC